MEIEPMKYFQSISNFLREFSEITEHARTGRRSIARKVETTDMPKPR